jgi:hypothetical protein
MMKDIYGRFRLEDDVRPERSSSDSVFSEIDLNSILEPTGTPEEREQQERELTLRARGLTEGQIIWPKSKFKQKSSMSEEEFTGFSEAQQVEGMKEFEEVTKHVKVTVKETMKESVKESVKKTVKKPKVTELKVYNTRRKVGKI